MNLLLALLSLFGFLLSTYAFFIQVKRPEKPWCDLKSNISCTSALLSDAGFLTGLPNSVYGLLFYATTFFLAFFDEARIVFYLSLPAVLASLYLGYALWKQKNYCVVCIGIYGVNVLLLLFSFGLM